MASIGLTPGQDFDPSKLSTFDRAGVNAVPKLAMQRMLERFRDQPTTNGWIYFGPSVANWGTDYCATRLVQHAWAGLEPPGRCGLLRSSEKSADGKDYDGNNKYVLRFEKGQMPPVNDRGFWSLTMYDGNRFFVPNALNRYTLSQRDNSSQTLTGQWAFFSKRTRPARTKRRIGCPLRKGNSASCSACTGPRKPRLRSLTALGNRRR